MITEQMVEAGIAAVIEELVLQHTDVEGDGGARVILYAGGTPQRNYLTLDVREIVKAALSAATALSQAEGAPDRDAVLAAVLHEFGPDGCAKVLARLPEARDYVKALRKPTRPREQEGADLEKIADFWEPHWRGAGITPTADWLIAEIKAYSEGRAHPLPAASFQAGAEAMREAAAKKARELADVVARIMAAGWRGNPNMSGDDRDFMHTGQRRHHDNAARAAVEHVEAAIRKLPIPASSEGR